MFYTLEEAAEQLGMTTDEVTAMADGGQIQEFRDRDKLMFKKEQIDLLSGNADEEDSDVETIGLADTGEEDAVELKEESVLGLADSNESTGISIFDADELEAADPAAATQISDTVDQPMEFSLDSAGSGSGLLDLTREADDTSLGAELEMLDEIYQDGGDESSAGDFQGGESGLFDSGPEVEELPATGGMVIPAAIEAYDGAWSGAGVGFAIAAILTMLVSAVIMLSTNTGTLPELAEIMTGNYYMYVGIAAGVTFVLGIIGFVIGKATG